MVARSEVQGPRIIFNPSVTICIPKCYVVCQLVALQKEASSGYKLATLTYVQIYLSHFNLSSLIHLLVVLMFLSDPTLGYMGIYMTYFYNQLL
ncbi:ribonuclease H-like [Grus japonensis]|uniref:Ribonuclease H-like n=1 Tax=Grus japonensis TaxID=30415 RepID=A0ABC9WC03_GRUJA